LAKPVHLAGRSLLPLLENPNAKRKQYAVSQFPNPALREVGSQSTFFGDEEDLFRAF
jgi:hypothetical protein